jgi:hypothetical protein
MFLDTGSQCIAYVSEYEIVYCFIHSLREEALWEQQNIKNQHGNFHIAYKQFQRMSSVGVKCKQTLDEVTYSNGSSV